MPRIPELEAALDALAATRAQRNALLARLPAPRAGRRLRSLATEANEMPPPAAGDLLRALRFRLGWTQEHTAARAGVAHATLNRWERGERLPSQEALDALCICLGAAPAEREALVGHRFTAPTAPLTEDWADVEPAFLARLAAMNTNWLRGLQDLQYLLMERTAWEYAQRDERARSFLVTIHVHHGHYLRLDHRWAESRPLAERALSMVRSHPVDPVIRLRAMILQAAILRHGEPPAPEPAFRLLHRAWTASNASPEYEAWILADMAQCLLPMGHTEAGLAAVARSCRVAEACDDPVEAYLRRCDHGARLLQAGRPAEALRVLPQPDARSTPPDQAGAMLLLARGYHGDRAPSQARDWLAGAMQLVQQHHIYRMRPHIANLARRL